MSTTIYFSKLNVTSHMLKVYVKEKELNDILKKVFVNLKEGTSYDREDFRKVGEEYHLYKANFKFKLIQKYDDNTIVGSIIKTSNLFINKINEDTGVIKKIPVENSEIIEFYFDVHEEIIAFYTTNRFGYQEFNMAFEQLLNTCMVNELEKYTFDVVIKKNGLSVNEITKELKKIGKLESLKIEVIPPNADDDLLDSIQDDYEENLEEMIKGNVTHRSTIFTSKAPEGLNVDSKIIKEQIHMGEKIHSKLSSEEATGNGYVKFEATSKNGRTFSTDDHSPIKFKLQEVWKNTDELKKFLKEKVDAVLKFRF